MVFPIGKLIFVDFILHHIILSKSRMIMLVREMGQADCIQLKERLWGKVKGLLISTNQE